jgi:hypothetical protein
LVWSGLVFSFWVATVMMNDVSERANRRDGKQACFWFEMWHDTPYFFGDRYTGWMIWFEWWVGWFMIHRIGTAAT